HGDIQRKKISPEPAQSRHPEKHLPHRISQQQSVSEMNYTVEIVALPTEQFVERTAGQGANPVVVRNQRVGVVRPNGMYRKKNKNEEVGNAGQRELAIAGDHESDENQYQRVLEQPGLAVVRCNRKREEFDGEQTGEDKQELVVRQPQQHPRPPWMATNSTNKAVTAPRIMRLR